MSQWQILIDVEAPLTKALSQRWNFQGRQVIWVPFWKILWSCCGLPLARLINWRVLYHAYFTNARGSKWGVTLNVCRTCNQLGESINHLFFDCEFESSLDNCGNVGVSCTSPITGVGWFFHFSSESTSMTKAFSNTTHFIKKITTYYMGRKELGAKTIK